MSNRLRLILLTCAVLFVRCWFTLVHRIDSDEPQHLHVAWGWAQGLVQYRDVFDNHLPLLHVLFAPLLAIVPESSGVFTLARWAVAPFAIACSWMLYAFARPLFGARVAFAAALLFSVMPIWLPKSVEFRNDTLWILFWLAALALLTRRRRNAFLFAGIALGLSLLASIKAIPLVLAHLLVMATQRRPIAFRATLHIAMGIAVPLVAAGVCMLALGALDDLLFGSILFNASAPVRAARRIGGALTFAAGVPVVAVTWTRAGRRFDAPAARLALFAFWYSAVLLCFWPIVTERDFLPLAPLAAIAIALHLPARRWHTALAGALVVTTVASIAYARLWRPRDQARERFVDAAVRLTAPDDYVFDLKGDAVFRRRPVYYIYEDVGRALTASGAIPDSGPEHIAARGCCAAIADSSHIPPRTRAFLNAHFLGNGPLRVCGTRVEGTSFEIAVPQTYAVIADRPELMSIDGKPYRGPLYLDTGRHAITRGGNAHVTIIWARAAKEAM